MNAVEIEEAISALAEQPFDAEEFPFAFLEAFGNRATTIKRLRGGSSNKSDLGGVLQTNNIHIVVCAVGAVAKTLAALKASPATARASKFTRTDIFLEQNTRLWMSRDKIIFLLFCKNKMPTIRWLVSIVHFRHPIYWPARLVNDYVVRV